MEVSAGQEGKTLAQIGERVITLEEFQGRLSVIPDAVRSRLMTPEGLRTYLKGMVFKEVFSRDAVRLGLEKEPRVQARLEEARRQILYDAVVEKIMGEVKLDEPELMAYFEAHRAEFAGKDFPEVKAQVAEKARGDKLKAVWQKTEQEAFKRWRVTLNEELLKEVSIPQSQSTIKEEKGHPTPPKKP